MAKMSKWSPGDWYLAFIATTVGLTFLWAGLGKLGIVEAWEEATPAVERPRWDNRACLRDEQYRIRSGDPLVSDEDLFGQAARRCVLLHEDWERARQTG